MKNLAFAALLLPALACAEPVVQLDADARAKVANDEMVVNLSVEREGTDSSALTDSVLSALNAAVKDAKAVPGVAAQLGNVSTNPNWNNNKKIGWVVRGELTLTSKDLKGLSALTGELSQKLQLSGVSFRLSDERRLAEEGRLLKIAAANFKEKAQATASAFGFPFYMMKEMTVSQSGYVPSPRPYMMMNMAKAERAAVPVEGGDSEVVVTVSGKIDLTHFQNVPNLPQR